MIGENLLSKFKREKVYVGLDISEEQIKAVVLKKETEGFSIKSMGDIPTPKGTVSDGEIADPKKLAEAVKNLLRKAKISENNFFVILHTSQVIIRIITIPSTPPENLGSVLREEVDRYVLFAGLETMIGYQVLERDIGETQKKMKVALGAVTADIINTYRALFKYLNLNLEGITLPVLALVHAFDDQSLKFDLGEVKLLVMVDYRQSYFIILTEGKTTFIHVSDFGTVDFSIEKFTTSLNRTLSYYKSDGSGEISKIVIYLVKPEYKEEIEKIKETMEIQIEWGFGTIPKEKVPENLASAYEALMPAIGVSKVKKLEIDFLPSVAKAEYQAQKTFLLFIYFTAAVCIGMLVLFFLLQFRIILLGGQINQIKNEIQAPSVIYSEIKEIETKTKDIESLHKAREETFKKIEQLDGWINDLKNLSAIMPMDVKIRSANCPDYGAIFLQGEGRSSASVFELVSDLKKIYSQVQLDISVSPGKEPAANVVNFTINGSR